MRGKITLVTGGARSGKSTFAEELAKERKASVAYLATAIPFDEGMQDRIKKHQASRPQEWTTYEGYKDLHLRVEEISQNHKVILLDCVTIWITNLMFENPKIDWDTISHDRLDILEDWVQEQISKFLQSIRTYAMDVILVTNEVGMGIVPESRLSRIYRDMAGRMNQRIAKEADEVYFTVSGLPLKIK